MNAVAATLPAPARAKLGPFDLIEHLAEGSHGPVYRGIQRASRMPVAIQFLSDPDLDRFDPARISIASPTILEVLATGIFAKVPYVVTPLAFGRTLLGPFDDRQRSPVEAASIVASLAESVGLLHHHGIVHLRLSPRNIVLGDAAPILLDLGTARHLRHGQAECTRLPVDPTVAAPEQWLLGSRLTPATDVYQLGALLRLCWTGAAGGTEFSISTRLLRHVPNSLRDVCARALATDVHRRFKDGNHFAVALRHAIGRGQTHTLVNWWRKLFN